MEKNIYSKLKEYSESGAYPFHMPGHKRRLSFFNDLYEVDITEIDGFDDLHHAEGVLKEGMERMAAAVGAKKSWYLVGGSTCGILSAVHAAAKPGGNIVTARNCHISVANAITLRRLHPVYIYPQIVDKWGISRGISADKVEEICGKMGNNPVFILTSPTYEGFVSEISDISEVIHKRDGILIVDEAHGAHLPFAASGDAPASAVSLGADIVIQSLHKTLPALTMSAALHLNSDRVSASALEEALRIYETSSPSYVLMAGMDACVSYMQNEGKNRLRWLYRRLDAFYEKACGWKNLEVLGRSADRDKSRIAVRLKNRPGSGQNLAAVLRERYHLEPEYTAPDFVLLLTSLGDCEEGFTRLEEALSEIDREQDRSFTSRLFNANREFPKILPDSEVVLPPWQACEEESVSVPVEQSAGMISAEQAFVYPPGIPFLMPGERISKEHVRLFSYYREAGYTVTPLRDPAGKRICCVAGTNDSP